MFVAAVQRGCTRVQPAGHEPEGYVGSSGHGEPVHAIEASGSMSPGSMVVHGSMNLFVPVSSVCY